MEDRRVADYFVVAGLPQDPELLAEFSCDEGYLKPNHDQAPITDITVIFTNLWEAVPKGFTCIQTTPSGFTADLNHGSLRSPEVYLCYRRGRDKPPLVDIGVMFEGKERIMTDSEVVLSTPYGRCANVNNSGSRTFLTYRRALETNPCNELVVTDMCVILTNKGEAPPHAFCMIHKNLNKGMVGSDVYLCYKKSMNRADLIPYKPEVLARYPRVDSEQFPFPSSVPMFCLPMGATLECWPAKAQQPRPVFSTFVLTVADAAEKVKKVYGSAVTFYERYPEEKLSADQKKELKLDQPGDSTEKTVNVNKCICILSHWPFFDTFEKYLMFLYNMSISGPHPVPIERYIAHLLEDTPFPSAHRPRILVQLSPTERVVLTHSEDTPLPRSGASFRKLLTNLGPDNCLLVLLLALTEQKILLHSLRPDVLTAVVEAVAVMIFPFHWQCPYIPLCPLGLSDVLNAPLPFLIGVDSRFFDLYDPPPEVHCVDLDTNTISLSSMSSLSFSTKLLPKRPARVLRATLQGMFQKLQLMARCGYLGEESAQRDGGIDRDFRLKRKELLLELEIEEAFLRFMATILKGYRSYLLPITKAPTVGTTDASSLFDLQGFLRSRDKTHHKFFSIAMKTQMFIRFIEERSFVSNMDNSLAFFDECTEKMDVEDSETRLVELDESHTSERTVFVMPPEPVGLPPGESYEYRDGFQLNLQLFKQADTRDLLGIPSKGASITPGSPIARRTKQEIKSSQKKAKKYAETPMMWAKFLLNTCFSLWFIHLPSHVMVSPSKSVALWSAYDILVRMKKAHLQPADEVCYRVMMQLCGAYSQPVLAVKVLFEMKRSGILPNAITYGFYNKAVLEAQWPSHMTNSSQMLWNKLRNVIIGVAHFRRAARRGARRRLSLDCPVEDAEDRISRTSLESGTSQDSKAGRDLLVNFEDGLKSGGKVRTSTGSQSDVGYSSLNEAAAKSSSLLAMSEESDIEKEKVQPDGSSQLPNLQRKAKAEENSWVAPLKHIDFSASDSFRSRVGSIVKSSASSLATVATLPTHPVNSAAGLLITSQIDRSMKSPNISEGATCSPNSSGSVGSSGKKWRHQSASASDFKSGVGKARLRHGSESSQNQKSPTADGGKGAFCMLRSESFASDAQILDKLRKEDELAASKQSYSQEVESLPLRQQKPGPERLLEDQADCRQWNHTSIKSPEIRSLSVDLGQSPSRRSSVEPQSKTPSRSESQDSSSLEQRITEFLLHGGREKSEDRSVSSSRQSVDSSIEGDTVRGGKVLDSVEDEEEGEEDESKLPVPKIHPGQRSPSIPIKRPPSSPSRIVVTENDPLGALDCSPKALPVGRTGRSHSEGCDSAGQNREERELDDPLLKKPIHRSSTMPPQSPQAAKHSQQQSRHMSQSPSMASSLSSLGSSFKLPFSRYSPARLSLRKADFRKGTQMIENALTSFSPSSFNQKNAEFLMEGINSLKSAASTMAKKFDEIKEAISANSAPVKPVAAGNVKTHDTEQSSQEEHRPMTLVDLDPIPSVENLSFPPIAGDYWGSFAESFLYLLDGGGSNSSKRSNSEAIFQSPGSTPYSSQRLLVDALYPKGSSSRDIRQPIAVEVCMTTCTKCHNCSCLLYDEEIMAGWLPEDSNLNTKCEFCKKLVVPFLQVLVKDYRNQPLSVVQAFMTPAPSMESMGSIQSLPATLAKKIPRVAAASCPTVDAAGLVESQSSSPSVSSERLGDLEGFFQTSKAQTSREHSKGSFHPGKRVSLEESILKTSSLPNGVTANPEILLEKSLHSSVFGSQVRPDYSRTDQNSDSLISNTDDGCRSRKGKDGPEKSSSEGPMLEPPVVLDSIIVPYLSPVVLCKEMETVLEQEGDVSLTKPQFMDEHPIIFWNMLWVFQRVNLPSYLQGLCLFSSTVNKDRIPHPSWSSADHKNVAVRCLWDNHKLHEEFGYPMYWLWRQAPNDCSTLLSALLTDRMMLSKSLIQHIISSVQCNDLSEPLRQLVNERRKQMVSKATKQQGKESKVTRCHSAYRDIFFLALVALGRDNINQIEFDREFRSAYGMLPAKYTKLMHKNDGPPSFTSIFCRHYFKDLEL